MARRMLIMLLVVGLLLAGIFGFEAFKADMTKKFMAKASNPPQTVSTMRARKETWALTVEAVGSLRAHSGTDISPEVAGTVSSIHFKSGENVSKGHLLVTLDAQEDLAKLKSLKAAENIARITYRRDRREYEAKAISRQIVDTDLANLKQAKANVAQQQAVVNYKFIRAPFSGHLGIRQVDIGQYLNPGTAIVTLQSLNPIYADFHLPQQDLSTLHVGQNVTAHCDVYPEETFKGKIVAINPTVNTNTRNVEIRAELRNRDRHLLTGMYATVDVVTGKPAKFITLPQTAITYNPYGDTVYVVQPQKSNAENSGAGGGRSAAHLVAEQQFVKLGVTRGDQVQILSGVKVGDEVVTAGQIKLHNGSPVIINNKIQPSDEAHPTPQEQ